MQYTTHKAASSEKRAVANSGSQKGDIGVPQTAQFVDNRPEATVQRTIRDLANNSAPIKHLAAIQSKAFDKLIQRVRTPIYSSGHDVWEYDDVAQTILKNDIVLISDVTDIEEARGLMLDRVRFLASNEYFPEDADNDALPDDEEAQMLDQEFGEQFDGEYVIDNISEGGAVYSAGASTCVIVIMVGTVNGDEMAVCRHFTAGTDHFQTPAPYVAAMAQPLAGAANIEVYAVGGVESSDDNMDKDFLALAQALGAYDIAVFNVPAFDVDDNPENIQSVEASFSEDGFRWRYQRGQ